MKMEGLSGWSEISPREILGNSAVHLDKEWMLLTAGDSSAGVAAMTINWGMFGFLWNKAFESLATRFPSLNATAVFLSVFFLNPAERNFFFAEEIPDGT